MTFDECTEYLDHMPRMTGAPTLEPMRRALSALVKREPFLKRYKPRIIHVAGTNGKGSTCAMLEAVFRSRGEQTGLYISPHLIDYTERIRVSGENIPHEYFARLVTYVINCHFEGLCAFDVLTLTALLYFAETKTELLILETGLGGTYDATTAVCEAFKPLVTAITSVSLDHMQVLGKSLNLIAEQKAGIILPEIPMVLAKNPMTVRRVVQTEAFKKRAPYTYAGALKKKDLSLWNALSLKGSFQKDNLALVLAILKAINQDPPTPESLSKVSWPARQQRIETEGAHFIIDGAHNPDAFLRLIEDADGASETSNPSHPQILLFGMLGRKDVDGVIKVLAKAKCFDKILYTSFGAKEPLAEFAEFEQKLRANGYQKPIENAGALPEALAAAKAYSQQTTATVWCAGSLYLAGELLKALGKDGTHC